MLIKVTPHARHQEGRAVFINTEKIIRIVIDKIWVSIWLDYDNFVKVEPAEWERIEPMVMAAHAPAPASPQWWDQDKFNTLLQAWYMKFKEVNAQPKSLKRVEECGEAYRALLTYINPGYKPEEDEE